MEDDLGAFMNVERVEGILFDGRLIDGSKAARAVTTALADPWDLEASERLARAALSCSCATASTGGRRTTL